MRRSMESSTVDSLPATMFGCYTQSLRNDGRLPSLRNWFQAAFLTACVANQYRCNTYAHESFPFANSSIAAQIAKEAVSHSEIGPVSIS